MIVSLLAPTREGEGSPSSTRSDGPPTGVVSKAGARLEVEQRFQTAEVPARREDWAELPSLPSHAPPLDRLAAAQQPLRDAHRPVRQPRGLLLAHDFAIPLIHYSLYPPSARDSDEGSRLGGSNRPSRQSLDRRGLVEKCNALAVGGDVGPTI